MMSSLSVDKTLVGGSYGSNMMQQIQMCPENVKIENGMNCIDNDSHNMYGLIEDVFLIDDLNLNTTDPTKKNPSSFFVHDNIRSTISEKRPFESFEKQITISVPQPPPLKAEAFTIGGGLFQGNRITFNLIISSKFIVKKYFVLDRYHRSHKHFTHFIDFTECNRYCRFQWLRFN